MINDAINKIIAQNDLSQTDTMEVFDEILSGLASDIQTSSFVSALKIKGESEDEITGAILASREAVKKICTEINPENIIENIKLAFDDDFIDISLAQDIICCANGLNCAKYSIRHPMFLNKSFEVLSFMGVNLEVNTSNAEIFEKTGFLYANLTSDNPYFKYSENILRNLPFLNIFNTTSKMLNPLNAKNQFIGVLSKNDVQKYANICLKLNNTNSIVLSGANNFPYISLEGETTIAEAWKNKIFAYVLTPDLLGFKNSQIDTLKCENNEENANILNAIFENKIKDARYDAVVINSALSLYIAKKADSIMDGIELAKKTIDSSLALEKIEQIKSSYIQIK